MARTEKQNKQTTLAEQAYREALVSYKTGLDLRRNDQYRAASIAQGRISAGEIEPQIAVARLLMDTLPTVKRLSYDHAVADLVESTSIIPTEDVLGQLRSVALPFDEFWIEGPFAKEGLAVSLGYWVKTTPNGLTSYFVTSTPGFKEGVAALVPMSISSEGITFDQDILEAQANRPAIKAVSQNAGREIVDSYFLMADHLARLMLILGSNRFPNDLKPGKTDEEIAVELNNRKRERLHLKPKLPTTPIRVDLSAISGKNLAEATIKQLRVLLGWTSVRRSKPIMRKDGTFYTRKPHDRRIAADIDRRNVDRAIILSNSNVSLEINEPPRPPALIRNTGPAGHAAD